MPLRQVQTLWGTQPQEAVGIDWANPITAGLLIAVMPSTGINHVTGRQLARLPSYAQTTDSHGVVTSAGGLGFPEPANAAADGAQFDLSTLTALVYARQATAQNVAEAFFRGQGSGTPNGWGVGLHGGSFNGAYAVFGGTLMQPAGQIAATNLPTVAMLTASATSGLALYCNGRLQQTAAFSAPSYGFSVGNYRRVIIGSMLGNTQATTNRPALGLLWNRVLSADEARLIAADPWQVFEPRRIWVPQAGITGAPSLCLSDGALVHKVPGEADARVYLTTAGSLRAATAAGPGDRLVSLVGGALQAAQ